MEPGTAAYNVPLALMLSGPLAPAALAAALDALAARHETLRTALAEDLEGGTGQPVQVIAAALALPLPRIDLSGLGGRTAEALLPALRREAARPFDLTRLPLVRAFLFRLAAAEHLLLVNLHHAVTDIWSLGILLRDLLELYGATRDGRPAALPELPIQYADFAAWQRDWLQGEALEQRLLPWRRRLEGAPGSIALPTDRPRGAGGGFERAGGHAPFDLPRPLVAALRELGRAAGATPFMVLLAGFEALLARLSGQGDLVVGTTVANRDRSEIEDLIGLFVNTLPLRGELADDPAFADHLARVREVTVEAFAHADLPFERLVEELKPERRLAENPLFEVAFAFQQPPLAGVGGDGLRLGILEIDTGVAKFELVLHAVDGGDAVHGFWEYRTALFDRTTVERLTRHLETLLAAAAEHPERRVSELALLSPPERQQVAVEWSAVEAAAPVQPLAYELFAAQAARTPERPAAIYGGEALTYRQLAERAERLARRLRAGGAGRERPVALLVERSLDLPVAVLAALAAGAPYVPLDPEHPRERLALLVADAGVAVIAAQGRLRERLPATGLPLVLVDGQSGAALDAGDAGDAGDGSAMDAAGAAPPPLPPLPSADPDDLAYVLFTSGSTGRPKGVAMPHRALANLLAWQLAAGGGQEGRATLQFAPLSFDASFQEMLGTWGAGGTLVLLPDEVRRDPEALLDFLDTAEVGRIFFPSIALQQLAQAAARRPAPRALRELVTAGEQLQVTPAVRALVSRLRADAIARPPGVRLHNHYGPTEAHVVTALILPDGDPARWPALPAIGRPIPGAVIRLLGADLAPAAIGVPGELYIGGACLARGYQGRPELTAERFVPDPYAISNAAPGARQADPDAALGARLYRTGDLARWRADGVLEYLGRGDGQVKVRGVRVEPAEVEAALAAHPQVGECAVVARQGAGGETFLAAYVVARGAAALSTRQLRDFLRGRLPDALVPSAFVELARLPRTVSGKIDRAALPAPGVDSTAPAGFVAPRTPVEEVLAGIWSGVLRLERIGAHDNFFDLGGHSLSATTVTAQARSTFRVELPTRTLFEAPTLAELALRVEQLLQAAAGLELPPIVAAARDGDPPLSFAQQRLWFLDRLAGGESPFYNIAAALGLAGRLAPAALAAALAEIVRRHETLRTTFRAGAGGEAFQVVHPPAPFPLPVIDLETLPAAAVRGEIERLARADGHRPFRLAAGPLLRVGLVRLGGDDRHALLLSMHHIVSDGWSLDLFVRELAALYAAAVEGRPSPLRELPLQYADFALWQRRWLAGPVLEAQLAYWRRRLAGAPLALELPTDRPRPALQTYAGRAELLRLPRPLAEALAALARGERATLFMVLLGAFAALLERTSGQDDMLLGTPIANRTQREVEELIGVFVNTLVLRVELAGEPSFRGLLSRVRETALAAYAHQDLPFERLVEALQPARDLSRNPLFQVSFSMGSTPWHHFEPSGLAIGSLGIEVGNDLELFDLTLQVFETPHGLDARLAFNADLFDSTTVARLGRRLETLLAAVAADPDVAPGAVPLLSPAERQQLREWGGAAAGPEDGEGAAPPTAVALFLAQAALRPAAPALAWAADGGELSYEELDRRSSRLARHLEAAGVGPESVAALALDGGVDFATAVLAVWKAGGAYLPLAADLPRERVAFLLADSGARLVVTRGGERAAALAAAGRPVVDLGADAPAIARRDPAGRPAPDLPASLAYLIYTSGSTGRPKGVLVSHGALAAHVREFARRLDLGPGDRVLQVASFAFDVSLDELVPTLAAGATFVPWRPEAAEPAALARALAERAITVVNLPTALWHQAARAWSEGKLAVPAAALEALRWVLVGGEALPPRALELWRRTPLAAVPLANGYGPTEAVVTATLHAAGPEAEPADLARLPIGRPFAGRALHLVDRRGELAAPGAVGEIHLGGAPLARGYLGRPERTAEAFVPDPFSAVPGARLYRSGDLARRRGDGSLEFLGRRDRQLKVRGFRVEPGEVEAALLAHPDVRQAAVVLADGPRPGAQGAAEGTAEGAGDTGGGAPELRTLAAYLAPEPGREAPRAAELRAFLGGRLPPYMVPSTFAVLPALPMTAGGKVDRAALPAASRAAAERKAAAAGGAAASPEPAAPGTPEAEAGEPAPLEALVAGLWREVLGLADDEVGLDDNFFDLGGHSMLLALVLARLQEELAPGLTMIDLFDHPTVSALAGRLLELGAEVRPAAPAIPAIPAIPVLEAAGGARSAPEPMPAPPQPPAAEVLAPAPDRVERLEALEALVAGIWREALGREEAIAAGDNFFDLGGHSLLLTLVHARLQEALAADIPLLDLFEHPTLGALADHLAGALAPAAAAPATLAADVVPAPAPAPASHPAAGRAPADGERIAIVGMAGRFPGASDVESFWRNLVDGVESISFFLPAGETWRPPAGGSFNVPAGGAIDDVELWDADFFGYPRREAELMDPQHRIFLDCAWEALEDAGYGSRRGRGGRVGVFGGATQSDYLQNLAALGLLAEPVGSDLAMVGNEKDYLAVRVSYKLALEGPSLVVSAACSTSLVAVHLAAASLLAGECDMALAGAVSIAGRQRAGYLHRPGSSLSPTGRCRPFDAASDGTVDSDGAGIVVLKRLSDALAAGDAIRAVIRGSAMTNDGAEKIGFLAPRTAGRAAAVAAALARAGISPAEIGFVEAHGVGLPLGDAIEVAALHQAFGAAGGPGTCVLGSVKGNIGHPHGACGVIGLIKATLALERRQIPPTLHFERPSAEIDLAAGPFHVNVRLQPWESDGAPRRAGVSSFGHGGVNVHAVLEEGPRAPAPAAAQPSNTRPWQLLLLAARSEAALAAASARLAAHLARHPEQDLADVAFTLQVGREGFAHRRAVLCSDRAEAAAALAAIPALAAPDTARAPARTARRRAPAVVFLLPGAGGRAGLGAGLYAAEESFRAAYDRVAERLAAHLGRDLRAAFPAAAAEPALAEPALFAYQVALAETLRGWGVRPDLLLGEGVGELAAAVLAGTLELDGAAALAARRGGHGGHPAAAEWEAAVAAVPRRPPATRWISASTGGRVEPADAVDPRRWAERLTAEPRLAAALRPLLADRLRVLLPLGPAAGLAAAARTAAGEDGAAALAAVLPAADLAEPAAALATLGNLWVAGVDVDWAAYHRGAARRRVPLPTYPFERQRFWVEPAASSGVLRTLATAAAEDV